MSTPFPPVPPPPDAEPPAPEAAVAVAPRQRTRGKTVAIVVLAALLAGTAGVGTYLYVTTQEWERSSADWEQEARGLGEDVAHLQADLDGANAELESARGQLTTAQDRITELADEKAQLGDQNVVSQQYLDYQNRVSAAAGTVAAALNQCTAAQKQLIGYLNDRESYDPADIESFAGQVDELCAAATDANTQLQEELDS